ncbi:uncharacterized protein LOC131172766 [Hevea brasiliensis]|uniref:uncharacterized protein LOC131172766 n=1 Tax=Hevea brasiliensis TaxID=3981 RepID=UPI0025EBFD4F|nr:uncharacterized protein LOC131172766 [Hevea brasiliensis]
MPFSPLSFLPLAAKIAYWLSESVPTGLKSESIRKLAGRDVASGKDGLPCGSTSFSCFSRDATSNTKGEVDGNSSIKWETDQESVGDLEYNGSFTQLDDHGYFQADGSHIVLYRLITSGMQSDNGSLVYYLPGYNPYASGAVKPCLAIHGIQYILVMSQMAILVLKMENMDQLLLLPTAKSSGFNSMKSNDNTAGKSSKSTNTQAIRPLNKVSALGYDFSAGLSKGYHPVGNLPPFSIQKHGPFPHNCPMNYRQNGRIWNGNDRNKSGDRFYKNSDFETSNELTSGPRGSNKFPSLETAVKEDLGITVQRDQYNKPDFETKYADAKFYVIKSYNEDDIHKSIKYDVWASTPNGNKKLDAAFHEAEQRS